MILTDFYKILGVPHDASTQEIEEAFNKLAGKFHPDFNAGDSFFEERFKEITHAYTVLANQETRMQYDHDYESFTQETAGWSPRFDTYLIQGGGRHDEYEEPTPEYLARFENVLHWKDKLGFQQYWGSFTLYEDKVVFDGKGDRDKKVYIEMSKDEIERVFLGSVSLNFATTAGKKYRFDLSKFEVDKDILVKIIEQGLQLKVT